MILIAGPCVIDEVKSLYAVARELKSILKHFPHIDFYFKSSCVKDNRSKLTDYYGPGFNKGVIILQDIKKEFDFKISTDFHSVEDIKTYSKYVDLIQIPAFLAKQTSIIRAAAETGLPVHIKKPQFIGPHHISSIYSKINEINKNATIFISDRGTCFGYDYWMFDPRHIRIMRSCATPNVKLLADVTHPNQFLEDYTYAFELGTSAIVSGADGIFLETHNNVLFSQCAEDTQIPSQNVWEYINAFSIYYNIAKKMTGPDHVKYRRSED